MTNDRGLIAERPDLDLGLRAVVNPIARGADNSENGCAIQGLAVGRDIDVVVGHQPLNGGRILLQPGPMPGFG